QAEVYLQQRSHWIRPDGGWELCLVIGSRLEEKALGAVRQLTPDLRLLLAEQGAVVVDESDLDRLGLPGPGGICEMHRRPAKGGGLVHGFGGLSGAYVFCSLETAQELLRLEPGQVTYILARRRDPSDASAVVGRLRASYPQLSVFTAEDLSLRSRLYWLTKTKGGLAMGYA